MTGIMLTEPASITSANYKLLPAGQFHRTRNGKVKAGVVHVTAGLQDLGLVGTDESAEGTNRWALNSGVVASWCRISDTDGVERCLPSIFVAYQAKGYNTNTVGNEISNVDARWDNKPAAWVKWTIWYAALAWADLVVEYNLPMRRATQAELDRAIANDSAPVGFIDHSRLSVNRSDPGATFPWALFFKYIKAIIAGATHPDRLTTQEDEVTPQDIKDITNAVLTAQVVPAAMLSGATAETRIDLPRALDLVMRWALEGRDNAIVARKVAEAQAAKGEALTETEIDAIGVAVGKQIASGFQVELTPKDVA